MNYKNISLDEHAFMSPSNYHWLFEDREKFKERCVKHYAATLGTKLHAFAEDAIRLLRKQPKNKDTVNMYINDCIGFAMKPEVKLVYSRWCFGTADALKLKEDKLMIFDLKTGITKPSMKQLQIYSALYCLQEGINPNDLKDIELRIYYQGDKLIEHLDPELCIRIMDDICDKSEYMDEIWESIAYI